MISLLPGTVQSHNLACYDPIFDNQEILSYSKIKVFTLVRECNSISIQLFMTSNSPVGM
jgi:hypothetical protein